MAPRSKKSLGTAALIKQKCLWKCS